MHYLIGLASNLPELIWVIACIVAGTSTLFALAFTVTLPEHGKKVGGLYQATAWLWGISFISWFIVLMAGGHV